MWDTISKQRSEDDVRNDTLTILQAIFMPFILYGNFLIITAYILVSRFKTVEHHLLIPLAIVDFCIGLLVIPMQIHLDLSSDRRILEAWYMCMSWYILTDLLYSLSLSYLTNIIIFKSLAVNFPFQYLATVSGYTVVAASIFILAFNSAIIIPFDSQAYKWINREDAVESNIPLKSCREQNIAELFRKKIKFAIAGSQMLLSCVLCVQLTIVIRKLVREISNMKYSVLSKTTPTRERRKHATNALLFLYLVLWLPTLILPAAFNNDWSSKTIFVSNYIARQCRIMNSTVNVAVYAYIYADKREAYKFLILNPPWKWDGLNNHMRMYYSQRDVSTPILSQIIKLPPSPRPSSSELYSKEDQIKIMRKRRRALTIINHLVREQFLQLHFDNAQETESEHQTGSSDKTNWSNKNSSVEEPSTDDNANLDTIIIPKTIDNTSTDYMELHGQHVETIKSHPPTQQSLSGSSRMYLTDIDNSTEPSIISKTSGKTGSQRSHKLKPYRVTF